MNPKTKKQLREWADTYENGSFIHQDPVQFPRRFTRQQDIEIVGLLTAWISFGNRKMICKKAEELLALMGDSPLTYVLSKAWENDCPATDTGSFYRTCSKSQMNRLFRLLHEAYSTRSTLEEVLLGYSGTPRERLCQWLGVSSKSPQKKLNMFLRWMIRKDSPVDLGVWEHFSPRELIIPLDTHVNRVAFELGLTDKPGYSLKQAFRITEALKEIFPDDPCKGDFALFGYGVAHK